MMRDSIGYCSPAPDVTIVPPMPEVTMWVVLTGRPVNPETPITIAEISSAEAP